MGESGLGVGGGGGAEGAGAGAATAAGVGEGAFWDVVVGGAEADTEGSSIFRGDTGAAAVFSAGSRGGGQRSARCRERRRQRL